MRAVVERMMEQLRLPVNARKVRCVRVPEEPWSSSGTAWGAITAGHRARLISARVRARGPSAACAAESAS